MKKTIWIGILPEAFGYGFSVVAETREECFKALRKGYTEMKKSYQFDMSFDRALEYFGGGPDGVVFEVELGRCYNEGFR